MTTACAEGAQRPNYDIWHQSISALSLGPNGWIQVLNFVVFGAIVLSSVPVWRRVLAEGRGATLFPFLTALTGASLIVCGFVPQDPAPGYNPAGLVGYVPTPRGLIHLAAAGIAAVSSLAGLIVIARRFVGDPVWRGWSAYSLMMAIAMAGCVTVYAVWSTSSTGYAGTFERLALLIVPIWGLTFLMRLRHGAPFMCMDSVTARN